MDHPRATRPLTLAVHGVLLAGAAAAVFLTGGPAQGTLGVFLVCAGLALTFCPPLVRVDGRLWLAAGGLVAGGALAFLPMRWFPTPAWRAGLAAVPTIPLPPSISPVPWETAFWLAVLAVSLLGGLLALAHPLRSASLLGFGLLAVAVCATYAALAIYARRTGWHYRFDGGATFGFFPNRNHTATLLVTGSVVAMGVLRVAWRDGRWLVGTLATGGLAVCVVALCFFSGSRGGVVFLLVGTVFWVAGLGRDHRNAPLLVSLLALAAAGGALFLVSGSEVSRRLLHTADGPAGTPAAAQDIAPDFRVFIYRDTMGLVRDFPLTGTGLGTFAMVFPQYRQQSLNDDTALHPESDWLMLFAEAGLPAGLSAATLAWLLLRRARRWSTHPSWPLHWAYASAVAAAWLHGVVDVPAHRVALGWWVLVLGGAGLHGGWPEAGGGRSRWQHALFVLGGIASLALGAQLIRAQWFGSPPLPPFVREESQEAIYRRYAAKGATEALALTGEYLRASPLYGAYYAQLGTLLAQSPHNDSKVDEAFKAQRLVDPRTSAVPFDQGNDWLHTDISRTAPLWREALVRRRAISLAEHIDNRSELELFRRMMGLAGWSGELQDALLEFRWPEPDFILAWTETAYFDVLPPRLQRLAHDPDFCRQLSEEAKRRFLLALDAQGDTGDLQALMHEEAWRSAAWPFEVRDLRARREFETLVRRVGEHTGTLLELPGQAAEDDVPAQDASVVESDDPGAAFLIYWRNGNTIAARRVLDEAIKTTDPALAPEVWRLKAALAVHDRDWSTAWNDLEHYLRLSGRSE